MYFEVILAVVRSRTALALCTNVVSDIHLTSLAKICSTNHHPSASYESHQMSEKLVSLLPSSDPKSVPPCTK